MTASAVAIAMAWSDVHAADVPEAAIKSALVLQLAQYVTWPAAATNHAGEFVIAVLGPDSLGRSIDHASEKERIAGKRVRTTRSANVRELGRCDLVYITREYRPPLPRTIHELHRRGIFTVGESDGFINAGGMARLNRAPRGKFKVELALSTVRQHGFNVNAQLLRVCDVVAPRPD